MVKRRAAEAIVRQGLTPGQPSFAPVADIYALLKDADRFVRYAGRLALEHTPRSEWLPLVMKETQVVPLTEGLLALTNTLPSQSDAELAPIFDKTDRADEAHEPDRGRKDPRAADVRGRGDRDPERGRASDPQAGARRPDRPDAQRGAGRDVDRLHQQDRTGELQRRAARPPPGQGARLHRRGRCDRQDPGADAQGQRRSAGPDRLHVFAPRHRPGVVEGTEAADDRLVRESLDVARRLDVRRPRQQHLRGGDRCPRPGGEAGGVRGGAAVRAAHRRGDGRCGRAWQCAARGAGRARRPVAAVAADERPAAGRRPRRATCRSIDRSATTTSSSRAAAAPAPSPAAAAHPTRPPARRSSATSAPSATASAPSARTTRPT